MERPQNFNVDRSHHHHATNEAISMSDSTEDAELLVYAINAAKEANVRIPNAGVETDRVHADRIFQLIDKATIGFFELKY